MLHRTVTWKNDRSKQAFTDIDKKKTKKKNQDKT